MARRNTNASKRPLMPPNSNHREPTGPTGKRKVIINANHVNGPDQQTKHRENAKADEAETYSSTIFFKNVDFFVDRKNGL